LHRQKAKQGKDAREDYFILLLFGLRWAEFSSCRFLTGREGMVPYSIQRLKPAWFRHNLITLFDLLQQKKTSQ